MIWVDNPSDLQANHQGAGQYCYCDLIIFPSDLTLQAVIPQVVPSTTSVEIFLFSSDGATLYTELDSDQFDWYITTRNGKSHWICRMRSISQLCQYKCFVLYVQISSGTNYYWQKFTEQYCIDSCCLPVTQIKYQQENYSQITLNGSGGADPYGINNCGKTYAIASLAQCYSAFTGYLYSSGSIVAGNVSGEDIFGFYDFGNIKGSLRKAPREIVRTISRNCRTQEVERTQKWIFESEEQFPLWKVEDIENWLSNNRFLINNKDYVVRTQTPFERIGRAFTDQQYERYKLRLELEECREFQLLGCAESCVTIEQTYAFVVPASAEAFYSDNGVYIAGSSDELLTWLRSIDQTTAAEYVYLSPINSQWNILTVAGLGSLPSAVYANSYNYANKIPAVIVDDADFDFRGLIPVVPCGSVIIGVISSEEQVCAPVTIDSVEVEDIPSELFTMMQYQNWRIDYAPDQTYVAKMGNVVQFSLSVDNENYPISSLSPVVLPNLSGEIIAVLPYQCRPTTAQSLDHNNFATIPDGANIIIDPSGYIYYSGPVSNADTSRSYILIYDIIFYI